MNTERHHKKLSPISVILTVIAILVVVAGAVYFVFSTVRARAFEETNDAQVESYINPISARVGGYIEKAWFEEHQMVKEGDTLVTLEDREYRTRVQEAEAAVAESRAQLRVLSANINAAEIGTLAINDQINGAKARFWQQQQEMNRYENLIKQEAVTGADFDQVKARFDVASSDYDAARNNFKSGLAKVAELQSHRDLLVADLRRKEAALELARINLDYTVIRAPYGGRMGRKNILEGQQIQPGQPLVSIVNEKQKWITANFKEDQVPNMYIGQPVDIRVDAIRDKVYHGTIASIAGSTGARFSLLPPDNSTGNFVKIVQRIPVKIIFADNDMAALRAGMNVNVAVKKKAL